MSLIGQHYPITFATVAENARAMKSSSTEENDWLLDRKIVDEARRATLTAGFDNDNFLIANALRAAGISHVSVNAQDQRGPYVLDGTTQPALYLAATRPEGDDLESIVRAVGKSVDIHTPDALPGDRAQIFRGFIHLLGLPALTAIEGEAMLVSVNGRELADVIAPDDFTSSIVEWTVSPYANIITRLHAQSEA